jgi:putative membrane protein
MEMQIIRVQRIPCAMIALIAASFSFSCESQYQERPSGYAIQPDQKKYSLKKKNDAAFVTLVANELLLESQLAQLALRRATSAEVKEFAISVMTDHSIALDELREIASRNDIELSEELSPDERKDFALIAKKEGVQFDRAFCDFIYLNHRATLQEFEKIARDSNSEILGNWAWEKLGTMKRHIATAQKY